MGYVFTLAGERGRGVRTIGADGFDPVTRPCGVDTDANRSESELLADAAMALLGCRSEQAVFDAISAFLSRLCPGAFIIVNELSADHEQLITRSVSGLGEGVLATAQRLLGFDVVGLRAVIVPEFREPLLRGRLWQVPGGFVALASAAVPRRVAKACAAMFGLHDAFIIGIADRESVLGNAQIITREPATALPTHTIESFMPQCFSALLAIRSERERASSVSGNEFISRNVTEAIARLEVIYDDNGYPKDYCFLEANPALEAMVGLGAKDIIGHRASEVLPDFGDNWTDTFRVVATTGAPAQIEGYSEHLGGRHLQVLA